ncbi:MAG: sigma-70 family RNA polymerase sigma factor [Oscillospiraceae bacterium]
MNATYISSKDELPSVFCDADLLNMSNVDLCKLIQAGNKKAIDAIYQKNIKLIKKCADKYKDFCGNSIDIEDLIASGAIGLIEATKKFDCDADVEFSTYAFSWIRKYIFEELNANASTIRIPPKVKTIMRKIKKITSEYDYLNIEKLKKIVTEKLSIDIEDVDYYLSMQNMYYNPTSLETKVKGSDDSLTIADTIEDEQSLTFFENIHDEERNKIIYDAMSMLTENEKEVICRRFGFLEYADSPQTYEQIAKALGKSVSRICSIEKRALQQFQSPEMKEKLAGFIG